MHVRNEEGLAADPKNANFVIEYFNKRKKRLPLLFKIWPPDTFLHLSHAKTSVGQDTKSVL